MPQFCSIVYMLNLMLMRAARTARCPPQQLFTLRRDVVAQFPPAGLQGEVGHGDGRHEHHRDEHRDGRGLVARVHQADSHERAQDPAKAGDRAREPDAGRPDCCWVYLE